MRGERRSESGLTVIELLVVFGLITVLSAILIFSVANAHDRSKQRATIADMRTVSLAIESYSVDHDELPDDRGGIDALEHTMASYTNENGFPTRDQWGFEFRYVRDGIGYRLESFGKDGLNGQDYAKGIKDFTRDLVLVNGVFVAAPID